MPLATATARQEGLFEEAGVQVEIEPIQSGSEGAALLAGGDAQFAMFSVENAINSFVEGHNNVMTVPIAQQEPELGEDPHGFGSLIVASDGDIETLQDLEGEQIGTSISGGEAYFNAYQTLEEEGVEVSSIEWMQIPGSQHVSSLRQGQVTATVTPEPGISRGVLEGSITTLVDVGGVVPDMPAYGFASDKDWAAENTEVVEAVQSAVREANARLNSDRDLAEESLKAFMDLEDEVLEMYRLPVFAEEPFTTDSIEAVAHRLVEFDVLAEEDVTAVDDVLFTAE